MNAAERKLIEEFPWLSESDLQRLAKRPWLRLYLEADDESLDRAVERHSFGQSEARKSSGSAARWRFGG